MSSMDSLRTTSALGQAISKDTGVDSHRTARAIRLWPAIVIVAFFWIFHFSADYVEMTMFFRFISRFGMYAIVILSFLVWWMGFSRIEWKDRWLGLGALLGGAIIAGLLEDPKSLGLMGLAGAFFAAFPFVLTAWTAWIAVCKGLATAPKPRRIGLCAVILGCLGFFDLVRWEGLDGGQHSGFAWRWSQTAEDRFLASHIANAHQSPPAQILQIQPGDWPEFRGPARDNRVYGVKLATDWQRQPPKLLWRHPVGPAWSSVIVVDGKLFTQEQRGKQNEAVVCYDAQTGEEIWAHEDATRFEEPLSGAGPRSTPTFASGRIYSLGGTGTLDCLDAATGKPFWSLDVVKDGGAEIPTGQAGTPHQWGYSNSPLVVDGKVIVFAGGGHEKGLLAYSADSGERIWEADAGKDGYSSPQLISVGGQMQVLMHSDQGLSGVDPATGRQAWTCPNKGMVLPITQPQPVGDSQFLAQAENGIQLVSVSRSSDGWSAERKWESGAIKVSLADYVVHNGSAYGFSDGIFCCMDLESGKRRWKGGRYGHGQVLLLADQPLLFVMSESGECVLIAPDEKKLNELTRFQAIEGKTWNHPVIAHGKLYARNAEEMACYDLPAAAPEVVIPSLQQ